MKHTLICEHLMDHQSACVCGAADGKEPSNDALIATVAITSKECGTCHFACACRERHWATELAQLREKLFTAHANLNTLVDTVEALKSRARRFKGWRIVCTNHDGTVFRSHLDSLVWWRMTRKLRLANNCYRNVRIVRVYRKDRGPK
jgi:hypothetical protein